jgi:hypothetical protein
MSRSGKLLVWRRIFEAMAKLALFLAGMLLGMFITMFIVLHQREHALELGPQIGHAAADDNFTPCEYLTKR